MIEKLFTSKNRVKILEFILFDRERSYLREISRILKISPNAVKRELDNLRDIGLIQNEDGEVKANKNSNIIDAIKEILIKTDYAYYPIKRSLDRKRIDVALIFGSFDNDKLSVSSDIDLLVVGRISQNEVFKSLKKAEVEIGREINPIVWNSETLIKNKGGALLRDIMKKKKIFLIGNENELQKIVG